MDVAFEIGLVFGTLLGVVLGLAGSYALSRKFSITPGEISKILPGLLCIPMSSHGTSGTEPWTELVACNCHTYSPLLVAAIWNLSSKHTGPAKSGVLLETLSDVHAQYIERATLSTTDRYITETWQLKVALLLLWMMQVGEDLELPSKPSLGCLCVTKVID